MFPLRDAFRMLAALALALPLATQAQLRPSPSREGLGPRTSAPAPLAAPEPLPAEAPPRPAQPMDNETLGRTVAHAWLLLLDRQDWGTAWDSASNTFRQTVPLGTWMDNVPGLRKPLGALVEREPFETAYRTSLAGRPPGQYVTAVFNSRFANKTVREVVTTVREDDGRWRVLGYTIQ